MRASFKILVFSLTGLVSPAALAQNLDKIGSDNMASVSGGVSLNTIAYAQRGLTTPGREPFTWFASGNVTVNILDVTLPFTFTYSNQGGKFTQPFNRTALHPSYKWVKSHIGIVSMNFSPYTLTGHLFLGAGVELTPGNWKVQAMAGRLNKAVEYDPLEGTLDNMTYSRFGYGIKAGYLKKGFGANVTFFKANDNKASLLSVPPNTTVKPQNNLVLGVDGTARIIKNLSLTAEYALSGLTQNTNALNDLNSDNQTVVHSLIQGNETTVFLQAYNASLNYALQKMKIAFKYEHIDPGYKTLGGYYFNNDLENFTVAPAFTLFDKKLNIAINTGYQRNNLSSNESATTSRWVGSVNATYVPGQKVVLSGNYSNFSSFTQSRPTTDPFYFNGADTLNFYQLTQSASGMISYNFGSDTVKNVLQLIYNYQESTSLSGNITSGGAFGVNVTSETTALPTKVHLLNAGYTRQIAPLKLAVTAAGNINHAILPDFASAFYGPTINVQKGLWNQIATLTAGSTYNRQVTQNTLSANILNHRLSFTLTPKPKNEKTGQASLSANANWMQRFAIDPSAVNVSELNFFINLNYTF